MSRKSRRGLGPEDLEIWGRVAQTARPLHKALLRKPSALKPDLPAPPDPQPIKPKPVFEGRILRPDPPSGQARHDVSQPLTDTLRAAPVVMDKRQFHRMTRGKLDPDARIDLHGMTLTQAHNALNAFILRAHGQGLRLVLVITGKGKTISDDGPIPRRPGALKHDVPQWLRMAPLAGAVLELREAHVKHGGSGAYYVYLRRAR
jgi:DNA-nicking Smr family endonuclease